SAPRPRSRSSWPCFGIRSSSWDRSIPSSAWNCYDRNPLWQRGRSVSRATGKTKPSGKPSAGKSASAPGQGEVRPHPAQPGLAKQRRRARVLAFQTLYESDLSGHPPAEVLDRLCSELRASEEARLYARELVQGVLAGHQEI